MLKSNHIASCFKFIKDQDLYIYCIFAKMLVD